MFGKIKETPGSPKASRHYLSFPQKALSLTLSLVFSVSERVLRKMERVFDYREMEGVGHLFQ